MANIRTGRKSGFILRSGVMRRETLWFSGSLAQNTFAAASTAVLLSSLNAAALALRPFTVIRTRGRISTRTDQVTAIENYNMFFGLCVVSDQASAIGVTAVPTPSTDNGSDLWFVFEQIQGHVLLTAADDGIAVCCADQEIDSKAMRKVEDGQDMIEVAESAAASSGQILTSFTRSLIKLH